ncbi:hypothetical protein DPMN_063382 [Dreissena polymorpha]|uniref:Uncharacterized protein n=1 Tax=Dreissena polymorpha TaxID=45954 RepID=A0A9D4HK67_DREPO|nr:hypothetical protein DPMN_063382 [Dreissena polymorpha]
MDTIYSSLYIYLQPKHASNVPAKDAVTDWEPDYPSGKPNEAESEASSEQVLPVMTYSLFDQSILNWPNIQTWAQKQVMWTCYCQGVFDFI